MSDQQQIHLVLIIIELIISDSNSLKEKRAVLNRIKDRVKSKFNAAVAEVGELDKWQRATLAVSMISNEKRKLQIDADKLETNLLAITEVTLSNYSIEWL
jgi:uncharacterized protein